MVVAVAEGDGGCRSGRAGSKLAAVLATENMQEHRSRMLKTIVWDGLMSNSRRLEQCVLL